MSVPTRASRNREASQAWRKRRADLLQAACQDVATRRASGETLSRAIKVVAKKFRDRSLGGGRQLALSAKSMERIWFAFAATGESAFSLRYVAGRKSDLDPLMLRLIVQGAIQQSKSVSKFLTDADLGERGERASLATIYRSLPSKEILRFLHAEKRLLAKRKSLESQLVALSEELDELRSEAARKFLTKAENA